jgi:ApaG protein
MFPSSLATMSDERKHHIDVNVRTAYVDAQSAPDANRFVFAYTVTITNSGSVPAKLLTRHWVITDANEKVQEVHGMGVVGEQPHLAPGTSFEYTSGTVLETPLGTMHGSYQMLADDGARFDAEIPPFLLSVPRQLH